MKLVLVGLNIRVKLTSLCSDKLYEKLENLNSKMLSEGYVLDMRFALHNVDNSEMIMILNSHSKKLDIAFGLLYVPESFPIRGVKNLRVCGDSHTATKFISKITNREILGPRRVLEGYAPYVFYTTRRILGYARAYPCYKLGPPLESNSAYLTGLWICVTGHYNQTIQRLVETNIHDTSYVQGTRQLQSVGISWKCSKGQHDKNSTKAHLASSEERRGANVHSTLLPKKAGKEKGDIGSASQEF
ncbi:pentatricopeptide (PPR) repeat-containing protein [Artemisia annua]|uniref:Pentatricopeptide (PPR) repeat-containing protein n=1 Tax=Artemisia annua TaxID=35608 RepID=A0A2U1Q2I4_ARTAN|nr:pentatricopeptide (PPR) repeat-containing protein [Artemisia annua]